MAVVCGNQAGIQLGATNCKEKLRVGSKKIFGNRSGWGDDYINFVSVCVSVVLLEI